MWALLANVLAGKKGKRYRAGDLFPDLLGGSHEREPPRSRAHALAIIEDWKLYLSAKEEAKD